MNDMDLQKNESEEHEVERRKFLAQCGRFAIATPPAITLLMSTSLTSQAIAKSGGGHGRGHGRGHGNWRH
jgi:formiminotetrahydrofolate cyclodeaminase